MLLWQTRLPWIVLVTNSFASSSSVNWLLLRFTLPWTVLPIEAWPRTSIRRGAAPLPWTSPIVRLAHASVRRAVAASVGALRGAECWMRRMLPDANPCLTARSTDLGSHDDRTLRERTHEASVLWHSHILRWSVRVFPSYQRRLICRRG